MASRELTRLAIDMHEGSSAGGRITRGRARESSVVRKERNGSLNSRRRSSSERVPVSSARGKRSGRKDEIVSSNAFETVDSGTRGTESDITLMSDAECQMERVWEAVASGGIFGADATRAAANLFLALHKAVG